MRCIAYHSPSSRRGALLRRAYMANVRYCIRIWGNSSSRDCCMLQLLESRLVCADICGAGQARASSEGQPVLHQVQVAGSGCSQAAEWAADCGHAGAHPNATALFWPLPGSIGHEGDRHMDAAALCCLTCPLQPAGCIQMHRHRSKHFTTALPSSWSSVWLQFSRCIVAGEEADCVCLRARGSMSGCKVD